jgi:NAD(P)H-dependent flavin oxidoreductase YrpB (nitropropane dioxygenase family)
VDQALVQAAPTHLDLGDQALLERMLEGAVAADLGDEAKAWKTIWSAGQGVGTIADDPTTADLCARLAAEFEAACAAGVPWPPRGA